MHQVLQAKTSELEREVLRAVFAVPEKAFDQASPRRAFDSAHLAFWQVVLDTRFVNWTLLP
jgi:hypothetical protein